ncbi:hypothetical protein [Leptolyngbya sp. CCY15150]|uniref:hypothetical protein n=1 Tax=Leptolyngbya sp. CCY15150 TaxID=2767772 RepID=UPI00194E0EE3|nr:hypothetical protein [Leptolyngbya sp. CCY15150]
MTSLSQRHPWSVMCRPEWAGAIAPHQPHTRLRDDTTVSQTFLWLFVAVSY